MAQRAELLESEVLLLPEEARARLAKVLLLSLDEVDDGDVNGIWAEEAERRYLEIERGDVVPIPSADVLSEARARLK